MKKYKISILITFSLLVSMISCSDWLDLKPDNSVVRDDYWKTKEDVEAAVRGCYAEMMSSTILTNIFVWGEGRADMITSGRRMQAELVALRDGEISENNKYCNWNNFYKVINNCNTVLRFAREAQQKDATFSEEQLKQYEAEALCVRSLIYFYLVRTFGDVPYITEPSVDDKQNYSVPKNDKDVIIDSLVFSLKIAEKNIPFDYGAVASNKGRFTQWSAKTLLADVYLWKEDYPNAAEKAGEVIQSGKFALYPIGRTKNIIEGATPADNKISYHANEGDIDGYFNSVFVNGNSVESIFELQFDKDLENPYVSMFAADRGYIGAKIENLSADFFPRSDIDNEWYDIRTQGVSYFQGVVWKCIGLDRFGSVRQVGESYSNWIFYRYSEVLLMRAEALTQIGIQTGDQTKLEEAKMLLDKVRTRANAPESTDLLYGETTIVGKTLEKFILEERARELAFEGKRWFDVLRHAKRDNFNSSNFTYLLNLAVLTAVPDKVGGLQNKWKGNKNSLYLPIHKDELGKNKQLVQNPFYDNKK